MRNIRRKAVDMKALRLSPEEGFVLSRVDAPLSLKDLVSLTGLDESRVVEIVEGLALQGALELDRERAPDREGAAPGGSGPADEPSEGGPAGELGELDADVAAVVPEEAQEAQEAQETPQEAEKRAAGDRELRKVYAEQFARLDRDVRVQTARTVGNPELLALCLDPDAQVINAIFNNHAAGLEHARLVAVHHHTHVGLDLVGRRSDILADAHVQRRLLCNPQVPDTILQRVVSPKPLMDVYRISMSREIPEITRAKTRELLQKKFLLAGPEERAALLVKTDGRCLALLVNCALDARTTQILCGRTAYTVLFIQSCARWSACPPALLTHLLKQPLVRQSPGLRKMVLKHPNLPSEAKRKLS